MSASWRGYQPKRRFEARRAQWLRGAIARHTRALAVLRIHEFRPGVWGVVDRRGVVLRWASTYAVALVLLADLEGR